MTLLEIKAQSAQAASDLCEIAKLKKGDIVVIGCSSSEVCGHKVGSASSPETAEAIFEGLSDIFTPKGIYIAAQCCEHLNRAIVTEEALVQRERLDPVCVIPQPKAGGSFATQAYAHFRDPIAVESIRADAGIDIGLTMIGMHLKPVAVPLRLEHNRIGEALICAARTRPKFIGGARAVYDENQL